MRKLKLLATTLLAIGVLSAAFAATASAEYVIESAKGGVVRGPQVAANVLVTDVGNLKCPTTWFYEGFMLTEKTETLTLNPTFAGCALASQKVTVTPGKCNLLLTKPSTTKTPGINTAEVDVKCGTGESILVKDTAGLGCEVKLGEQVTKGRITFHNEAGGTVLGEWELTGIVYSWTDKCPNAGGKAGNAADGTLSGSTRLSGTLGGVELNFSVE